VVYILRKFPDYRYIAGFFNAVIVVIANPAGCFQAAAADADIYSIGNHSRVRICETSGSDRKRPIDIEG